MDQMEIVWIDTDKLEPHPDNKRQGDIGAIIESIKHHEVYKPLVVQQSTNRIIAGNHTFRAMVQLGLTQVPVVYRDVDDDEALRIMLVDNRTNDLATYDEPGLADKLAELAQQDKGLIGTGFNGDDLDDLIAKIDNELPKTFSYRCPNCHHEWSGERRPE